MMGDAVGDNFEIEQDQNVSKIGISEEIDPLNGSFELTFEFDVYSSWYVKPISIKRLVFLGIQRPSLRTEALELAESLVKSTFDVQTFEKIRKLRQSKGENGLDSMDDIFWMGMRVDQAEQLEKQLQNDLNVCKENTELPEPVRTSCIALGNHFLSCGELDKAFKCFSEAECYCSTSSQNACIFDELVLILTLGERWVDCLDCIFKAERFLNSNALDVEEHNRKVNHLQCAKGLASLGLKEYKTAADCLIQVNFDSFECPGLLSAKDIAYYAGLCALATYDRSELNEKCLFNICFKDFLIINQHLLEAIQSFCKGNISNLFRHLKIIKNNFYDDLYLSPHVDYLLVEIRKKAMILYFTPYISADMRKMAMVFDVPIPVLENELVPLIEEGSIDARIDSVNSLLCRKETDEIEILHDRVIELGESMARALRATIIRSALFKNQIKIGKII